MPEPGSNRGYKAWHYIEPILFMLIGGGRRIEELREIIEDDGLRKLTGMMKIPSPSTVGDWIRSQGNAVGNVMEAIMKPYSLLPDGKRIKHASLDSEYYRADVMRYLRSKGTTFTIAVDKDTAVKELIKRIEDWRPFRDSSGVMTDREIGETIHAMNKLEFSFRLIVIRWRAGQGDLFSDGYKYHCIATDLEGPAEEVVECLPTIALL